MYGKISIGRDKLNDFVIDEDQVSRNHATLELVNQSDVFLIDTNSSNGIFVNGRRIKRQKIDKNDEIAFGTYILSKDLVIDLTRKLNAANNIYKEDFERVFREFQSFERKEQK